MILKGNELLIRITGQSPYGLITVDKWRFRRQGEPVATAAFSRYQGQLYLQGDFGNYRRIQASRQTTRATNHD